MEIKNRSRICLIVSAAIFALALILTVFGHGINLGIDFEGGLSMQYDLKAPVEKGDVESVLDSMNVGAYTVTVQGSNNNEVNIRIKDIVGKEADQSGAALIGAALADEAQPEEAPAEETPAEETVEEAPAEEVPAEETAEEAPAEEVPAEESVEEAPVVETAEDALRVSIQHIQAEFEEKIREKYPDAAAIGDVNYVGPVAGAALVRNAIISVLLATVLMLIYIAIRFDFNSGLSAVFGLVHDVLMMLSFMVIFRSFIQMNSSFIAAALTIVGYSINNTIVIFDRIRENAKKMPNTSREEVTNISIKESLGRTVCTTATTLITIVALCILGVASIREFALPIIIGILSGVYSANMINGYVWAFLEEKKRARKAAKA